MPPTVDQQTAVAAYFTEANAPSVIGTGDAQPHLLDALNTAGLVLEQIGKSGRLLNLAQLAESDPAFAQDSESISQALAATVRDCGEVQRLLKQLARHAAQIDSANAKAKVTAQGLGYTFS